MYFWETAFNLSSYFGLLKCCCHQPVVHAVGWELFSRLPFHFIQRPEKIRWRKTKSLSLPHETEFNFPDSYFRLFRWINLFWPLFILHPFSAALCQIFRSPIVEWIKAGSTCKSLNMTFPLNQNQSPQSHSPYLPIYQNLMKSALRWWVSKDSCSSPEDSFKTHLYPAKVRGWRTKVEVHLWSVGAETVLDTLSSHAAPDLY